MKNWKVWLTCGLTAVLLLAGIGAVAAEYGGQNDPLVTLSYLQQVLLPQSRSEVDEAVADALERFEDTVADSNSSLQKYIDKKLRSFAAGEVDNELIDAIAAAVVEQSGQVTGGELSWAVVQIPAGGTVDCTVGVQAILRSGAAICVSSGSPGLIDLSNGETLTGGNALLANHLYAVSAAERSIYTAQGCTLLIAGSYTVR